MILTFSQERFKNKIIEGVKITTIRADKKNRWKPGKKIQFWMHNPRNVLKKPYCFEYGRVAGIDLIEIYPNENKVILTIREEIHIITDIRDLDQLALADGFADWNDMKVFFNETFIGKRIHFVISEIHKYI